MTNLGETPADGAVGLTGLFASDAAWVRTQVFVARAAGTRDFNLEEEFSQYGRIRTLTYSSSVPMLATPGPRE